MQQLERALGCRRVVGDQRQAAHPLAVEAHALGERLQGYGGRTGHPSFDIVTSTASRPIDKAGCCDAWRGGRRRRPVLACATSISRFVPANKRSPSTSASRLCTKPCRSDGLLPGSKSSAQKDYQVSPGRSLAPQTGRCTTTGRLLPTWYATSHSIRKRLRTASTITPDHWSSEKSTPVGL